MESNWGSEDGEVSGESLNSDRIGGSFGVFVERPWMRERVGGYAKETTIRKRIRCGGLVLSIRVLSWARAQKTKLLEST